MKSIGPADMKQTLERYIGIEVLGLLTHITLYSYAQ